MNYNSTDIKISLAPELIKIIELKKQNAIQSNSKTKSTLNKPRKRKTGFTKNGKPLPKEAESIKTLEEINMVRQYFLNKKEYRNYMLWIIGISTAFRCGDILSLKFSDVLEEDKITFKNNIELYEQKTEKFRQMEITEPMQKAINLYINNIENFELSDYLFLSQKGDNQPLTVRSVHKLLKTVGRELKLPYNIGTHSMRKSFAYWFIITHKNDITALSTLMELLNHSSERITLAYAGISKEERRNMARDVSELWND